MRHNVFVSGGTGYIGVELIRRLAERGHSITALAREGSERKLPEGCAVVRGDALDAASFSRSISAADTFVHLVGVAHPSPWKARQFRSIDKVALEASVKAATQAGVKHFVFISVAHPAPAMRAYIEVRMECEAILARALLTTTILRPWYVLGPGHRWPYLLRPFYAAAERIRRLRDGALRLGLVTREQMIGALVWAVENPPEGSRILAVPDIRAKASSSGPFSQPQSLPDASVIPSTAAGSEPRVASQTSGRTPA